MFESTDNSRTLNEITAKVQQYFLPGTDEKENKKTFSEVKTWNDLAIFLQNNFVDERKLFNKYMEIMKLEKPYSPDNNPSNTDLSGSSSSVSDSSESTRAHEEYEEYVEDIRKETLQKFNEYKSQESNEEPIDEQEDILEETSRSDSGMSTKVGRLKNIIPRPGNNPAGGRQETDHNDMNITEGAEDDNDNDGVPPTSVNEGERQGKGKNKLVSAVSSIVRSIRKTDDNTENPPFVENPLKRRGQGDEEDDEDQNNTLSGSFHNPMNGSSDEAGNKDMTVVGGGRSKKIIKTKSKRIKNKYSKRKRSKRKKSKHKKSKRKKSIKK